MTTPSSSTITVAAVQSEPVWFDLDATVDKTIQLLSEAAANGAELIAFPETWLPGYPSFIWLGDSDYQRPFRERYLHNSLVDGSTQHRKIEAAAREAGIDVLLGLSERDGNDIYMAQFLITRTGATTLRRRKVKPSGPEWSIFTSGPGTDLHVVDSASGRIGALNCSENRRPLLRHIMLSQNEQIHVAAWPHFGLYPHERQMSAATSMMASAQYAAEGGVVTLAPTQVMSQEGVEALQIPEDMRHLLRTGGGSARVFGPEGEMLATPLGPDVDGILYAHVDRTAVFRDSSFDGDPMTVKAAT